MKRMFSKLAVCGTLALAVSAAAKADSIWCERAVSLVADNKAFRAGDVVTVLIGEDSKVTSSAASSLSKSSSTSGQVDALSLPSLITGQAHSALKGTTPKAQWSSARSLDGKGSYDLEGSMQTQIAAVVMEVLPNGNLVIEGSRLRKSADDKVLIRVSGIVRPDDISAGNTVASSAIAEGKIVFETSGPIARSNQRGTLDRIIDFIWPF